MPSKQSTFSSEASPVVGPPRLLRKRATNHHYKAYRKALSILMRETDDRCAYSLQHVDEIGGLLDMEVDHFNPFLTGMRRNWHGNLMPAARPCNNLKRQKWPAKEQAEKGIRFLNPYEEGDYGVHFYEHQASGELKGVTPAGKWHILMLGLNDDHLIRARKRRTRLIKKLIEGAAVSGIDRSDAAFKTVLRKLSEAKQIVLDTAIPRLPDKSILPVKAQKKTLT